MGECTLIQHSKAACQRDRDSTILRLFQVMRDPLTRWGTSSIYSPYRSQYLRLYQIYFEEVLGFRL
ncbi:hypothetical protein [Chamaesiphon sp. VAR_48_metabat_403]|uniref:hypothetical protein n=1 Tax=Chamaesiphon sp. VAR_48_metabat_403 TaxID=2964700 RepID=UPI00286E98E3|nr:hypothetical protein [Chamaesiphon sp. VAR_48_metabat_403]